MVKKFYRNPTANIIFDEKLDAFSTRSGTRQRCHLSPFLFNIVLEDLVNAIRQEKKAKDIEIGKEEMQLSLFTDDMIVCRKSQRLNFWNSLVISKVTGSKVNT